MSEKLCLQWNDFKENIVGSFQRLKEDNDFSDVTLVCEDGKQVEAHKVVLVCSSPVFQNILKRNKHAHPLLYMRGMKSEDLFAILDFLYCGETNVYQENLDSFLSIAEELELKGLMGSAKQEQEMSMNPSGLITPRSAVLKEEIKMAKTTHISSRPATLKETPIRSVALTNEHSDDMQKLDEQVNTMMTKSSRKHAQGQPLYVCNVCGKESRQSHMKNHIEANHLEGISVPCNFCEKTFRSRHSKACHISLSHKGEKDLN